MDDWKDGMSVTGRMPHTNFSFDSFGIIGSELMKVGRSASKKTVKSVKMIVYNVEIMSFANVDMSFATSRYASSLSTTTTWSSSTLIIWRIFALNASVL